MAGSRTNSPSLGPRSPLTRVELSARRAASRRRRARRRRALAGLVLAVAAIVAGVIALTGSRSGSDHAASASAPSSSAAGQTSTAAGSSGGAGKTGKSRPSASHAARKAGAAAAAGAGAASLSAAAAARARAVDHVLGYTSYVRLAGHRRREIALTFDDGPSPYTNSVLKILKRFKVPATFFVVGRSINAYPGQLAAELSAGEEVGDHTLSHPMLGALSGASQSTEIGGLARLLQRHHAPNPVMMRPPYGSFNTTTLQILRAQRMLMVLWSVDTSDYARPGVNRIVYTALSGAQPGGIILMHDGGGDRSQTVAALPRIIAGLRKRGYTLVTVARLVRDDPPPRHQPAPHSLSGGI